MHFSKLPSNPSLTKLMIFVPLKNHTPWFVLGLVKVILSVCTEKLFYKTFRYKGSQWQLADPGKLAGGPQTSVPSPLACFSWFLAFPYKQLLWFP